MSPLFICIAAILYLIVGALVTHAVVERSYTVAWQRFAILFFWPALLILGAAVALWELMVEGCA